MRSTGGGATGLVLMFFPRDHCGQLMPCTSCPLENRKAADDGVAQEQDEEG